MDKLVEGRDVTGAREKIGAQVEVVGLTKRFGQTIAVDDATFSIARGEFLSLLGPSGSGKTTVLMNIAGFQLPSGGRIIVGNRDVASLPANRRDIGMVFQRYALFPHMSVAQNIAFPLQMRGWPRARQAEAVGRMLSVVQLTGLGERMPAQLSGGQQQRVALARALVFEPPLLLMDEPLGALDKKLREELQVEIKSLQRRLGITVLFVTHDQSEALAMSDRIAVMNHGKIEQIGCPQTLYHAPQSAFVADFMGDSNFFKGSVTAVDADAGIVTIDALGARLAGAVGDADYGVFAPGKPASIMVRPEKIAITEKLAIAERRDGADDDLFGRVETVVFSGSRHAVSVNVDGQVVRVVVPALPGEAPPQFRCGEQVRLSWQAPDAVAFANERNH